MIKQFKIYGPLDFLSSGLTIGDNPVISNDVIFHNPENIIIGNNVRIDAQCIIIAGKNSRIIIGDNCHINSGCVFHGSGGDIVLENYVGIADKCVLYTSIYDFTVIDESSVKNITNVLDVKNKKIDGHIKIENDVLIGCSTTVFPNVTLGKSCVVGANSLVKESIKEYSVVAGTPTRFLKNRKRI